MPILSRLILISVCLASLWLLADAWVSNIWWHGRCPRVKYQCIRPSCRLHCLFNRYDTGFCVQRIVWCNIFQYTRNIQCQCIKFPFSPVTPITSRSSTATTSIMPGTDFFAENTTTASAEVKTDSTAERTITAEAAVQSTVATVLNRSTTIEASTEFTVTPSVTDPPLITNVPSITSTATMQLITESSQTTAALTQTTATLSATEMIQAPTVALVTESTTLSESVSSLVIEPNIL